MVSEVDVDPNRPAEFLVDRRQDWSISDPCGCNQLGAVHQRGDAGFCRATGELRDRAARAAADAMHDVVCGPGEPPLSDRGFKVAVIGWRAVVDAVAGVLAEHQAEEPTAVSLVSEHWRKQVICLLDQLDVADRKLSKQRKRRKAAEANYRHVREQLHNRTVEWETVRAECDALLVRVGNLRAALEKSSTTPERRDSINVVHAALAADDRAGWAEEEK